MRTSHKNSGMRTGLSSGWKPYAGLAIVLMLTVAAYMNSVNCSFHFDDYHTIVNNPRITDMGNIPRFFTSPGMDSVFVTGGYRPVLTAGLALNYAISGMGTWSYHVFNIIFHLACVLVVFLLAQNFAGKAGQSPYTAVLAAGIFALHPVHTNAVSYIIARSAVLCTFFYTLSFYAYVRHRDHEGGGWRWLSLSFASFILALLSKELAVTLPVAMLLYDFLVMKERRIRGYAYGTLYLLAAAAYTALKVYLLSPPSGKAALYARPTLLMAEPYVLTGYLRLFLFPVNLNFYPDPPVPASFTEPLFYLPFLFIAACLTLVVYLARKDGLMAFCIAWFFVTLIPETFTNLREVMVEYRLYLPSVGLAVLTGTLAVRLSGYASIRKRHLALAALTLLVWSSYLTFERNKVYKDDVTLWSDAVAKSPRSAYAHAVLGEAYLDQDKFAESVKELTAAFTLSTNMPAMYKQYNNLGLAFEGTGEQARAYEVYQKALSLAPKDVKVLTNLGYLCLRRGDRDEARMYFERVLAVEPDNDVKDVLAQMGGSH